MGSVSAEWANAVDFLFQTVYFVFSAVHSAPYPHPLVVEAPKSLISIVFLKIYRLSDYFSLNHVRITEDIASFLCNTDFYPTILPENAAQK